MDPPATSKLGPACKSAAVLTRAMLRSAESLRLTTAEVALVLGTCESHIADMVSGESQLEIGAKQADLATLLIRIDRLLDALVGNAGHHRQLWMRGFNHAFNETPLEAIQRADGLVRVVEYLESARTLS